MTMTSPQWEIPPMYGPPPPEPRRPDLARTNHILHLLLTMFTLGLWVIVWIVLTIMHKQDNKLRIREYHQAYAAWQDSYIRWQYGRPTGGA